VNFAIDILERFPASRPALIAIDADGRRTLWHFGELSARTAGLSGALAARGVGRGDVVMMLVGNRAEWVLAMMLAYEKRIPEEFLSEPPESWNQPQFGPLGGLAGATLGLVGVGAIGTEVAKRALAFDMKVVAHRRSSSPRPSRPTPTTSSTRSRCSG